MERLNRRSTIMKGTAAAAALLFLSLVSLPLQAKTMYTTDTVRMRTGPGKSYDILTTLGPDTEVEVNGSEGDWKDVSYDGHDGYIRGDFLTSSAEEAKKAADEQKKGQESKSSEGDSSGEKTRKKTASKGETPQGTGKISADNVNLRKKPKGEVIDVLDKGEKLTLYSSKGDWTKVMTSDGTKGYVYSSYIGNKVTKADRIAGYKDKAVAFCKDNLDAKYSQEKRDQEGYFDCSSLMRDAFISAADINIGETTVDQTNKMDGYLYKLGSIYDASYGDILYHLSGDEENHCGIYLGDGMVLNASETAGKVKIKEFEDWSDYWEYGCKAAAYCYDQIYK